MSPNPILLYTGLGWAMIMCGSAAVAFAVLVNQLDVPPALAASWRLAWVEILQISPFVWQVRQEFRRCRNPETARQIRRAYIKALPAMVVSGVCLGLHFSAWVLSIQMTSLAHSLLFVSMGPILLHGAAWVAWFLALPNTLAPSCTESAGVFLGLGGSCLLIWDVLLTAQQSSSSEGSRHAIVATWQGDLVALSGAATVTLYLTIGRHLRQWMPLWIYAFGVKGVAWFTSLAWALSSDPTLQWRDIFGFLFTPYIWLALYLGAGPGVCGHTLVNGLIKYISPLTVSTAMLSEPLFGGWLGYLLGMQDMPGVLTWTGGSILLVSLFLILASEVAAENSPCEAARGDERLPLLEQPDTTSKHTTESSRTNQNETSTIQVQPHERNEVSAVPAISDSSASKATLASAVGPSSSLVERSYQSKLVKVLYSTALLFCIASLPVCSSFSVNSAMSKSHVAVVGSVNYDLNSYTYKLPVLGETVMGDSFQTSCGGKGANQAKAAASLGLVPVTMVSRVGEDVFGQALLKDFDRKKVKYNSDDIILKDGTSSGVATIVVDNESGDNMIIVSPGANYALTPENVDEALRKMTTPPAVVVVQLEIKYDAALQALKTAKALGATTILNPAPAPTEEDALDDFFPFVDIFIPNETELRTLCGKVGDDSVDEESLAKSLLDKGVNKAVICTLGARGAMIVSKRDSTKATIEMVSAPGDLPCNNEPVVDTIGAGDAFCGALSTYLASGLDLVKAGNLACGFASMSVRRQGANYPEPDELPEMLRPKSLAMQNSAPNESAKPKLTFITGNSKKLEEVRQVLPDDFPFELVAQKVDLPELQGADPKEIAREKCRLAAEKVDGPCFTEDTCLSFTALNGMPGPYIKWFLEKCGHEGLNRMLDGFDDRSATASTIVAFTMGGGDDEAIHVFEGQTPGKIVSPRGSLDFGWDPVFEPDEGDGQTYAEMEKFAKNAISHRGRALAKFFQYVQDNVGDARNEVALSKEGKVSVL